MLSLVDSQGLMLGGVTGPLEANIVERNFIRLLECNAAVLPPLSKIFVWALDQMDT